MREGWEYKKLGEVATLINGFAFQSALFQKAGLPIVRISNIQGDKITSDFVYFNREDYDIDFEKYKVLYGDILIAMSGATTGKVGINYNEGVLYLNQRVGKIVPRESVIHRYLFYYLKTNATKSLSIAQGVAQPNLSTQQINSFELPVPPLSEQQRIVSELDLLSSIIEKKKAQLKEYDQLAQSIFYDMFGDPVTNEKGWEVKKIEDICNSIVRGPFGSALKKEFFVEPSKTSYKIYEQKHAIQKNATIGSYYVTEEKFKELSRFELKPYDIIMSCSGTIGELYRLPSDAEKGLMNQALLKFTLNTNVCYEYFMFTMGCLKKYFVVRGTGLQNIGSVSIIKTMPLGIPPLPLQQSFASKIEAIERQKALIQQSIAEVQMLFDSRMDYWFA